MMIIPWSSFWMHFGSLMGAFLDHFGVMLSSKIVLEALWESCSCWKPFSRPKLRPFWCILEIFWADFLRYFCICVNVEFAVGFHLLLQRFFTDLHPLWTSKNEQIAWEVLQKSKFRVVCYRMCLGIDFGRILVSGWSQFCVPSGLQKRRR